MLRNYNYYSSKWKDHSSKLNYLDGKISVNHDVRYIDILIYQLMGYARSGMMNELKISRNVLDKAITRMNKEIVEGGLVDELGKEWIRLMGEDLLLSDVNPIVNEDRATFTSASADYFKIKIKEHKERKKLNQSMEDKI